MHMRVHIHMHMHMYTYMCMHMYVCTYVGMYVCIYTCMSHRARVVPGLMSLDTRDEGFEPWDGADSLDLLSLELPGQLSSKP